MSQGSVPSLSDAASLTLDLLRGPFTAHVKSKGKRVRSQTEYFPRVRNVQRHGSLEIVSAIQKGFTGKAVERAITLLDLSQSDIARIMDATDKTVRSMKQRKTLDQTTSDKLFRLIKAFVAADVLFNDAEDARGG